ncbi:DUF2971 domain-containing protein [Pseudoalteromonas sp.]|uniref:DUF2971 domain-containing protein n=1 Tax=Pseudoalteromonas sp. TaxID=53249 RepID=UPI00272B929F|nr:DUF2971 domain-containing protein [Pseudoalteromonas sp.]
MKVLYKYMPLRQDFFNDPLLRLTQPYCLNDPFDSKPTKEAVRKKIAFMSDDMGEGAGFVSDEEINLKHADTREYLETELHKFGIISLTENPHNLLMWSHYADEHNGIVIAISNSEDTFSFSKNAFKSSRIGEKKAVRVRYDNKRPSHDIPDECIFSIYEDEFFRHFALVKSDSWMYEKEHRFLIPTTESDVAILNISNETISIDEFEKYLHQRKIDFICVGSKYIFENENINLPFNNLAKVLNDDVVKSMGSLLFFKRLMPSAIQSIYFGCRVSNEIIDEVIQSVRQNNRFSSNLTFYRTLENSDRFDVDFEAIYN